MTCKFCGAELEDGTILCPFCQRENNEESEVKTEAAEAATEEEIVEAAPVTEEETTEPEQGAEEITEVEQTTEESESANTEVEQTSEEAELTDAEVENEGVCEDAPSGKKKPKLWQIIVTAVCGVLVLAILTCAVLYGLGVDIIPRANDIHNKDSYTVADADADKWSGKVVATAGDKELTNGELQLYYWAGVMDFLNNYSYYLGQMGLDYTSPLDEQTYFNQDITWQQFFLNNAISTWHKHAVLIQKAQEEGFTLSQEEQTYLDELPTHLDALIADSEFTSVEEMLAADMGALCTKDGYMNYMRDYSLALGYFEYRYEAMAPSDADVEAYFAAHEEELEDEGITKESGKYYDVRHILIEPEGGTTDENGLTTYSDAEWEACLESAQTLLEQWEEEYGDEAGFALMAQEHSTDGGSSANGGLYSQLTSETNFVEEFKAWYLDENRQVGDTGLVKSTYGYHIMYFSGSQDMWYVNCYQAAHQERANELVEGFMEEIPADVNYKKIALGAVDLAS